MTLRLSQTSLDTILTLRTRVLRPTLPAGQLARYDVDALATTTHYGAWRDDALVGCATFMLDPSPTDPTAQAVRLRGMAVSDSARDQGVGARLLDFAMTQEALLRAPARLLWCNARERAIPFYTRMGFARYGEPFALPEIGMHEVMWRLLPALLA